RSPSTSTAAPARPRDRWRSGRPTGRPARPRSSAPRSLQRVLAEPHVAGRGLLGREAEDVDEPARRGLVERLALVVGGEPEVVEGGVGAAALDGRPTAVQHHPDLTAHVLLRIVDERVEVPLERREPLTVVHELGPALV